MSKRPFDMVSGHAPIFLLLTGHLPTDICWLDTCWLALDICWLRHLLILTTHANCLFSWDICWFCKRYHLLTKTFADLNENDLQRHLLIKTFADFDKMQISAYTTARWRIKDEIESYTWEVPKFRESTALGRRLLDVSDFCFLHCRI